ncbi:MAG: MT-A70 family methyltransferase [Candidatus Humimicrobiaceae bacterium]
MILPDKKYSIIYADPPWKYWAGGKKNATRHYNCMEIEEICNLPVNKITDENCILFLWITFPILDRVFEVINAWGFRYSTCGFVWIKGNKTFDNNQFSFLPQDIIKDFVGCGGWTRANSEICLIAKKGKIERKSKNIRQIIYSPIRKHSQKPDEVRNKIVQLVGDLPRIELFARQKVDGWDCWGNEI